MKLNYICIIGLIALTWQCDSKNGNITEYGKLTTDEYKDLSAIIVENLNKDEFELNKFELCYLNPTLDSLFSRGSFKVRSFDQFRVINVPLEYLRLNITIVEAFSDKYMFTSLIEKKLIERNNLFYRKEPLPSVESLMIYKDFREFNRLLNSLKDKDLSFSKRDQIVKLVNLCFQSKNKNGSFKSLFSDSALDQVRFDGWVNKHIGKKRTNLDISYEIDNLYFELSVFGLLEFEFKDNYKWSVINKVYPNDLDIVNSYDAGEFYLKECDSIY